MGKYYILSGMDEKNDYNFFERIAEIFQKEISNYREIVYISAYPNDYDRNIKLSKSEKFSNVGINFESSVALDYSYSIKKAKELIEKCQLVFLYGGDPYQQMQFIKDYDIQELIKDKTLITLSAGSINISKVAICTKDEDFDFTSKYKRNGDYKL